MFIKKVVLFPGIVLFPADVFAQSKGAAVSGTAVDKSSKLPIEFANVQLLKATDGSLVNATSATMKEVAASDLLKTRNQKSRLNTAYLNQVSTGKRMQELFI